MKGKVSERMLKDATIERNRIRNERFELNRLKREQALQKEQLEEELEEFQELDYLQFYPEPQRTAILHSLTAAPPDPLPPLDVTTISYYRRLSRPVFQTRLHGAADLDPHLTHESLHLLSMMPPCPYPNFAGLTREFERDLRLYLSSKSKDVRTMAVIAAGNRIIGREEDILAMVKEDEGALWVLFNHVFSEKISYEALLPYVLRLNPVAFRAFYELSNVKGQESIAWFFENDEVVDALLRGLQSPEAQLSKLTLCIFGNVLGEEQEEYVDMLLRTPFLEHIFRFLNSSQPVVRKDGCWVLANFCSYQAGAVAVVRNSRIAEKLQDLLYYEQNLDVRKEIAHIFSYLIGLGDKPAIFQFAASRNFLEIMTQYLAQNNVDLTVITLSVLQEIINLGEEFKDEREINIVAMMVLSMPDLMAEINRAQEHENSEISEASNTIINFLKPGQQMEGEL